MNDKRIDQIVVVARLFDKVEIWDETTFRFRHTNLDKGDLQRLQHHGIIRAQEDPWSTTTWEFTPDGRFAINCVEKTPVSSLDEDELRALNKQAEPLLELPRNAEWTAAEQDLRGAPLQMLSQSGMLDKADDSGPAAVWRLSDDAHRILSAIEAQELQARPRTLAD